MLLRSVKILLLAYWLVSLGGVATFAQQDPFSWARDYAQKAIAAGRAREAARKLEAWAAMFEKSRDPEQASIYFTQASFPTVASGQLEQALALARRAFDIIHFAVHAKLVENDPLSSALLLARDGQDDGRLRVSEIFGLKLKADMVVLSACETGLGKIASGDEIVGMTRAFIYAGTPSVVTTLWKVDDRASFELMYEFYANLKSTNMTEALRRAQLKTMKEFPHPYFWAAFGLTGEA